MELPEGEITAANAASLTGKLSQLANGAIYDDEGNIVEFHDRKLDALEDIIESANGKPLLVAYWFKHDLQRIKKRFDVREIKTSKDIIDWNNGDIPVAVIHPASAGHGLNPVSYTHLFLAFAALAIALFLLVICRVCFISCFSRVYPRIYF